MENKRVKFTTFTDIEMKDCKRFSFKFLKKFLNYRKNKIDERSIHPTFCLKKREIYNSRHYNEVD